MMRQRRESRRSGNGAGFTALEMVIVLSIIVMISGVVLVSFPPLSERINIQRSSRGLGLTLRKTQAMALAGREVWDDNPPGPPAFKTPPAFGVYFSVNSSCPGWSSNSYFIFADVFPVGNPDGKYDCIGQGGAKDIVVETIQLEPTVSFQKFTVDTGTPNQRDENTIHIAFSVPEGDTTIRDGNPQPQAVEIYIIGANGVFKRSVVVLTTGLIHVK